MTLYNAGTDVTFNTAVEALFTMEERMELGQMLTDVGVLIETWERDHRGALGLDRGV